MQEPRYIPLIKSVRNGLTEQQHNGIVIYMNKSGIIAKAGEDNGYKFFHRSCMKPLQAATLIDLEVDKKYELTEEEIAVCCASHTGDLIHREKINSVLKKSGCTQNDLLLTPHEPLSEEEKIRCIKNNIPFDKIHHNCSGKHAGMLLICKEKGYETKNYKDYNHPLTDLILNRVCELCETSREDITLSKDGCGLPVIATTLEQLGKGFLNLFCNKKYERIKNAFLNYPILIGGKNRQDTELILADRSESFVSKVGACGLCVVVNIKTEECIVVKIEDSNMKARDLTVRHAVSKMKGVNEETFTPEYCVYGKENLSDDNEVTGYIRPVFRFD